MKSNVLAFYCVYILYANITARSMQDVMLAVQTFNLM